MRRFLACVFVAACGSSSSVSVVDAHRDAVDGVRDAAGDATVHGDADVARSCAALGAICGPNGASSCCDSPLVPGGTFDRGYDVAGDGAYPSTAYPATVSAFRLDTYAVTVGRFRQFVNAGMGTQASPPAAGAGARELNGAAGQAGWDPSWTANLAATTSALVAAVKCDMLHQSWTDAAGADEALPMNCLTWYEAFAFCVWDGGFLPTDAEWNFAASGGAEERAYPWSTPPSSKTIGCAYANYYNGSAFCTNPPNGGVDRVGNRSPIGDGKWGQADLAGNVLEWTLDFAQVGYTTPCSDCANLTTSSARVMHGGNYQNEAVDLRAAGRANGLPTMRIPWNGVRCARAPS